MDKFKDPALILAVTANIGVVGSTAYFYKQLEAIRVDIIRMSQTLNKVVQTIGEMDKGDKQKNEVIQTLGDQMKRMNEDLKTIPDFGAIEDFMGNYDVDMEELSAILAEKEIPFERPTQSIPSRRVRSGDRRDRPRRQGEVDSFIGRSSVRTTDRSRGETFRMNEGRTPRREMLRHPSRSEPRMESDSEEEERDLVDQIRQQRRN